MTMWLLHSIVVTQRRNALFKWLQLTMHGFADHFVLWICSFNLVECATKTHSLWSFNDCHYMLKVMLQDCHSCHCCLSSNAAETHSRNTDTTWLSMIVPTSVLIRYTSFYSIIFC